MVFSTKERRPFLRPECRASLHQYMGGTVRGLGGMAEAIGGVQDHVHLLISLKTTEAPASIVRELKKATSVWVARHHDPLFSWQDGYAIFSVSWTHLVLVRRYIARQEEHHRKTGFRDELKRLLTRNGIRYDDRFLE